MPFNGLQRTVARTLKTHPISQIPYWREAVCRCASGVGATANRRAQSMNNCGTNPVRSNSPYLRVMEKLLATNHNGQASDRVPLSSFSFGRGLSSSLIAVTAQKSKIWMIHMTGEKYPAMIGYHEAYSPMIIGRVWIPLALFSSSLLMCFPKFTHSYQ